MTRSWQTRIALVVIVATMVIGVAILTYHHNRKGHLAKLEVRTADPVLAERINQVVTRLERESNKESAERLSDVNLYGLYRRSLRNSDFLVVRESLPLAQDVGQGDIDAIISNRRFCKVFDELCKMDRVEASKVVSHELAAAITEYLRIYEAEMEKAAPRFERQKMEGKRGFAGHSFAVGNVPEGEVVVAGARLKVLALVWVSGMLRLSACKPQIEHVVSVALNQRVTLYDASTLHPYFRAQMLGRASLYNRQIISSGLLGVAAGTEDQESILKAIGAQWQEQKLTTFRSALTEFDSADLSGAVKPDHSHGSLHVKFVSPLNDANFDILLKRVHMIR